MDFKNNKWLKFALSAVVGVILIFALVFEIQVPLPVFQGELGAQAAVRERIGFDSRTDSYLYQGADMYIYSDGQGHRERHVPDRRLDGDHLHCRGRRHRGGSHHRRR